MVLEEMEVSGSDGTISIAQFKKSGKFIAVWLEVKQNASMGRVGGKFIDAGHSVAKVDDIEDYTKRGSEDWEIGDNFVVRWVM
jgi:hypothetical protein